MEQVSGIGGVFFRSRDPDALSKWYLAHLGIALTPANYGEPSWWQQAGPTVFAPFSEATEYFGDPSNMWMINFRVANLDRMVAQLEAAGIAGKGGPGKDPHGRFARVHDPEGNPIELWEPAGRDLAR